MTGAELAIVFALVVAAAAIVIGGLIVLRVVQRRRSRRLNGSAAAQYSGVGSLLTRAERSFATALIEAVDDPNLQVLAKVHMSDVVTVSAKLKNRAAKTAARHRIDRHHFDFVLCDRRDWRPRLIVEFEDRSRRTEHGVGRDAFVDALCVRLGVPILRITPRRSYTPSVLRQRVARALDETGSAAPA